MSASQCLSESRDERVCLVNNSPPHRSTILHLVPASAAGPLHGLAAYLRLSVLPRVLNPHYTTRPKVCGHYCSRTFFFCLVYIILRGILLPQYGMIFQANECLQFKHLGKALCCYDLTGEVHKVRVCCQRT